MLYLPLRKVHNWNIRITHGSQVLKNTFPDDHSNIPIFYNWSKYLLLKSCLATTIVVSGVPWRMARMTHYNAISFGMVHQDGMVRLLRMAHAIFSNFSFLFLNYNNVLVSCVHRKLKYMFYYTFETSN